MASSASGRSPADLLCTIAEPTRLRVLNALAGAALFVTDLVAVLDLPQPTVSRHLAVLRHAGVVVPTPHGAFVRYQLARDTGPAGRMLGAILATLESDPPLRQERELARDRGRRRDRHLEERRGA